MTSWDTTRKVWLKEIRGREPTWKVAARSGQIFCTINVQVNGMVYKIYPRLNQGSHEREFCVEPVTQKRFFTSYERTLSGLMQRIRWWAKSPVPFKPAKKLVAADLYVEHGDVLEFDELKRVLTPFGLFVTSDPACEGSDSNGFIISNRRLSKSELKEYRDRH